MFENLPILLSYRIDENNLILRLDKFGLHNFEIGKQAIIELVLQKYKETKFLLADLQDLINDVFEYEIQSENNLSILEFWGDYGRIEKTIECEFIQEKTPHYLPEDLYQKGKLLATSYSDLYERFTRNENVNSNIRNKLKFEIKNEIKRFQRKTNFFADKDQSKSEAFSSQIKVLQKLLKIVD